MNQEELLILMESASHDQLPSDYEGCRKALEEKEKILTDLIERICKEESEASTDEINSALQRIIEAKTKELEARNRDVEHANEALQVAQFELLQSQKLESIGRLAAGIAHEINTPIQFVNDSIYFIQEGVSDLFSFVEEVIELAQKHPGQAVHLSALAEKYDMDYLKANIPKALERSSEGLSRVTEIVQSMKTFAHPDRTRLVSVNLNESITTTLAISRNEYKYIADVETDFDELPNVHCIAGEVNQVFLNLIVNAAHAIEEGTNGTDSRGKIVIRTRNEGSYVLVEIQDNGVGIPLGVQNQIFDPFFTTKDIGKGTGQGLSIARQVICSKHNGDLWFDTKRGEGTTFFIRLPVEQTLQSHLAA
jgi:signal transduction histidine kinase